MKPMSAQFADILRPRFEQMEAVAKEHADMVVEQMKINTRQGETFPNQEYKQDYSEGHARVRHNLGHDTWPVNFRMDNRRIETAKSEIISVGAPGVVTAEAKFQKGGRIFAYHHRGMGNNPKREIFPTSLTNIPQEIYNETKKSLHALLSGQ